MSDKSCIEPNSESGSSSVFVTAPITGDGTPGNPLVIPVATTGASGLESAADKTKLNAVPTPSSSSASLAASPYNVTGSWADIGLNLTLDAGTWLVIAEVLCFANTATPASGDEGFRLRLNDATAGAPVNNSERMGVLIGEGTMGGYSQSVISEVVILAVSSSIRVQAEDVGGAVSLVLAMVLSNSSYGRTRMSAVKIAD